MKNKLRRTWLLCILSAIPLLIFALIYRIMWNPALSQQDIHLRQSLGAVNKIVVSYYNHPNAFILKDQDAVDFIKGIRLRDEVTDDHKGGPSTDFLLYAKGSFIGALSLCPDKINGGLWLIFIKDTGRQKWEFVELHPATIRHLERVFAQHGHEFK